LNKTILIVSGGEEAIPGIKLAKQIGFNVVVSDGNKNAPGFKYSDYKIIASTYDFEASVKAALEFNNNVKKIDGVICIASDVPLTVAKIANKLNLPGISVKAAKLATNKLAMKKHFYKDKIPIPWFTSIKSLDHLKKLVLKKSYPLVIKPVDSRGSRGVLLLKKGINLEWAFNTAKKFSPSNRVMIEKFMKGPQVSTESLVIDGKAFTPGFSDRNYEFLNHFAPHIIENGGQLPSKLRTSTKKLVHNLIQKCSESMGIQNGVLKGDIVITNGKPFIIEIATRLSGGYFCSHEIPLNTGVDFVGAAIRQSVGDKIDSFEVTPKFNRPVAQRYIFPSPGKVISINMPKWISNDPEIPFFKLRVNKGDMIEPVFNHPSRAGLVIATGSKVSDAIKKAKNAVSSIEIKTL
tara:strand:- start:865 stop:2082 length:1218 start_codon:yes stop_codon:yes gene_type:complete